MLSTLDRYIIRSFLFNYVLTLLVMVSLYVLVDLSLNFDEFVERAAGWTLAGNIASYYGYNILVYYAQLAGLITVIAAAFTLARMMWANELTAILASGTSLYRVAAPLVVLGVLLNFVWLIDQEVLVPRYAQKLARPHDDIEGKRVQKLWFVEDGDRLVSAVKFFPYKKRLWNVVILERDEAGDFGDFITADLATWNPVTGVWEAERGLRRRRLDVSEDADPTAAPRLRDQPVYQLPISLSPDELRLRQVASWVDYLSLGELRTLQRAGTANIAQVVHLMHVRVTTLLVYVLMLMLGLPLLLRRDPKDLASHAGLCLVVLLACFGFSFLCHYVVVYAKSPALPAWLPILVFGPVAVLLWDAVKT
jgi:lipopolysaccharide export system permease protein